MTLSRALPAALLAGCAMGGCRKPETNATHDERVDSTATPAPSRTTGTPRDQDAAVAAHAVQVGEVLPDLAVIGYVPSDGSVSEDAAPSFAPTRLSALLARSNAPYAFVFVSAFWCSMCRRAGQEVVARAPSLANKALFIDLLAEGSTPTDAATKAQLDAWRSSLHVPFATVIDAAEASFDLKSQIGIRGTTLIVDRATRRIVVKVAGEEEGLTRLTAL